MICRSFMSLYRILGWFVVLIHLFALDCFLTYWVVIDIILCSVPKGKITGTANTY
ncbi:hypothetical protein HanRHA438_Chr10g0453551 [Helianthus annuus]|nr:hypothetical protein HanRHA438_Chr10g0453551 [Helianthus annuus]